MIISVYQMFYGRLSYLPDWRDVTAGPVLRNLQPRPFSYFYGAVNRHWDSAVTLPEAGTRSTWSNEACREADLCVGLIVSHCASQAAEQAQPLPKRMHGLKKKTDRSWAIQLCIVWFNAVIINRIKVGEETNCIKLNHGAGYNPNPTHMQYLYLLVHIFISLVC